MTEQEYNEQAAALRPQLLAMAKGYLGSDDAEDAVQDTLLKLWTMRSELRSPMLSLARVLTRNTCVDRLRRAKDTVGMDSLKAVPAETDSSDGGLGGQVDRMMAVIDTLTASQQVVLRLYHMEGMSTKEIAQLLGNGDAAVRQALSRARRAVLEIYTKTYNNRI